MLFIAGRQSTFSSQPLPYFNDAREKYAAKGMYVGITSIDALLDTVFASHTDMDSAAVLKVVCDTAEEIGKPEAQMWVYEHMNDVSKHLGFEYVATE